MHRSDSYRANILLRDAPWKARSRFDASAVCSHGAHDALAGAKTLFHRQLLLYNRWAPKAREATMASVLITGTSKGIGFEAALAFGRAGHTVHATMRNPSQSPELAATSAQEKLPITVSALDVDSDESVSLAIAS